MEMFIASVFAVLGILWAIGKYRTARFGKEAIDRQRREKALKEFERAQLNEQFPPPPFIYSDDPGLAKQERIVIEEEVPSWDDFSVTEQDALQAEAMRLFAAHFHAQYRMHPDHVNEYELVTRGWDPSLVSQLLGEPDLELAPSTEPPHPQNLSLRHYRRVKVDQFEEEGALRPSQEWRRKLCQEHRRELYLDAIDTAKQAAQQRYREMLETELERERARNKIAEVEAKLGAATRTSRN